MTSVAVSRRNALLAACVAAVLVVVAVVGYLLASSGSSGAATPTQAVTRLLAAAKQHDATRMRSARCAEDNRLGVTVPLRADGVVGYTVEGDTASSGMRSVTAHVTGSAGTSYDADFPVVKHGGSWLVCVTRSVGVPTTLPTPSDLPPTPSDTGGTAGTGGTTTLPATASSSTGTAAPALCAFAQLPLQAATTYVSAAEAGSTDLAQSCVYRSSVARTVTARLKGELFAARTTDPSATTVAFVGVDATTKVVVHVTKEPDGKYYVVGVTSG